MAFLDETGLGYFWSKLKQKFYPSSGGTVNGDVNATGAVRAGEKVWLYTDSEGGNIRIIAPDQYSRHWEMDAFDGNLRVYTMLNSGGVAKGATFMQDGDVKSGAGGTISGNFHFTPEYGKSNKVEDCLSIDTGGSFGGSNMYSGYIDSGDVSQLPNSPITSGAFAATRKVFVDGFGRVTVELIESYPEAGRIWYNTYTNGLGWSGWKCHIPSSDAVVAQGTSGIWTYRKYWSQMAECWGLISCPRMATYVCYKQEALPFNMGISAITTGLSDYNFDSQATWDLNARCAAVGTSAVLASVFSPGKGISDGNVFHVYVHVKGWLA